MYSTDRSVFVEPPWSGGLVDACPVGRTVRSGNHAEQATSQVLAHDAEVGQHRHGVDGTRRRLPEPNHRFYRWRYGKVHHAGGDRGLQGGALCQLCAGGLRGWPGSVGAPGCAPILGSYHSWTRLIACFAVVRTVNYYGGGTRRERIGGRAMRQRVVNTLAAVIVAIPAAALSVGTPPATAGGPVEAGGTLLPFAQVYRRCDFSTNTHTGAA